MACRDRRAANKIVQKHVKQEYPEAVIKIEERDLASLSSVRDFSDSLHDDHKKIDAIINMAGVVKIDFHKTEEGHEMMMGVNHFAPFVLTTDLLDIISPEGAIVNAGCRWALGQSVSELGIDFGVAIERGRRHLVTKEKDFKWQRAYVASKLANALFTFELQKKLKEDEFTQNVSCNLISLPTDYSTKLWNETWFKNLNFGSWFGKSNEISSKIQPTSVLDCLQSQRYSNLGIPIRQLKKSFQLEENPDYTGIVLNIPEVREELWDMTDRITMDRSRPRRERVIESEPVVFAM
eukprot:TRINITY_DN17698_c0_g1_i1.p1 TRINITY_DN17698_c0_g1~~TRINITY_DN17698_c0_g1_i1.p1  ORF type:complete len:324 (-),score=85.75 TRINITY_DN17698_c0_g1_i1:129-1007(-)